MIAILIFLSFLLSSALAGTILNRMVVEFPARQKIGYVAYANYTRAADLGNGLWFYPFLAIGSLLLELAALAFWLFDALPPRLVTPIGAAVLFSAGVMVITAVAAPLMLRVGKTDVAQEVTSLLDRFVRVNYIRTVFIWLQWFALLWATNRIASS